MSAGPVPEVFAPHGVTGESDLIGVLRAAGGSALEALFFALGGRPPGAGQSAVYPGARSVLADIYSAASRSTWDRPGPCGSVRPRLLPLDRGYEERDRLERRVDGRVAVALADASALLEAARAADPWDVAEAALMLLEVARIHGLVQQGSPAETAMERGERQENDRRAVADGVDRVRLASPCCATPRATRRPAGQHSRVRRAPPAGPTARSPGRRASTNCSG